MSGLRRLALSEVQKTKGKKTGKRDMAALDAAMKGKQKKK